MYEARTRAHPAWPELPIPEVEDDTEEAPWMIMGDSQYNAATALYYALDIYAETTRRPWYVASMLPIMYRRTREGRLRQVAPDVFVAFVARRSRSSYNLADEGAFPAFVLEVASDSSLLRDIGKKRALYEALGAQEYALFAPDAALLSPPLQGYRRASSGRFEPWLPDEYGQLWSDILDLWLLVDGEILRASLADGTPLLTPRESEAQRRQELEARLQETEERLNEAAARRRAEAELARLRELLRRFQPDE